MSNKQAWASCCVEVSKGSEERATNRLSMEQHVKEYVGWRKAGQEDVDDCGMSWYSRWKNKVMDKSGIEGEERGHLGRGEQPRWKEDAVTLNNHRDKGKIH